MKLNIEKKLWEKISNNLYLFNYCPFIRAVFLCNSLTFGKAKEGSDIDLFIVTKKERIWTSRLILNIILYLFGVKRHSEKVSERFCLSFFVDERFLNLSSLAYENDYYLAFWLVKLRVLYSDGLKKVDLINKNPWIWNLVENNYSFSNEKELKKRKVSLIVWIFEKIFGGFLGNCLEFLLKKLQLFRIKKKVKNKGFGEKDVVYNEKYLKFHIKDKRKLFNRNFVDKEGKKIKINDKNYLSLF